MIRKALYSIAFAFAVLPLPAAALEVAGSFIQGGLVTGRAVPGTRLFLDGKAVPVSPKGDFMLGFGRDVPPEVVLGRSRPDGGKIIHRLTVRQRSYQIQRIEGLPGARLRLIPMIWHAFARRPGWLQPPKRRRRQPYSLYQALPGRQKAVSAGCMAASGF